MMRQMDHKGRIDVGTVSKYLNQLASFCFDSAGADSALKTAVTLRTCIFEWYPSVHGLAGSNFILHYIAFNASRIISENLSRSRSSTTKVFFTPNLTSVSRSETVFPLVMRPRVSTNTPACSPLNISG